MAGPFYNNIKGTTGSAPGTGAFVPNAAASGSTAWSSVPRGWWGLVRFDDGSAWELRYSFWNATQLSRSANTLVASSTGSSLTLTASATAALVPDGLNMQQLFGASTRDLRPIIASASGNPFTHTFDSIITRGTFTSYSVSASTNRLSPMFSVRGATGDANSQALITTTEPQAVVMTSYFGQEAGYHVIWRVTPHNGSSDRRFFCGIATSTAPVDATVDPSAVATGLVGFGVDSADTTMQLISKTGGGTTDKANTGFSYSGSAEVPMEIHIWNNSNSTTTHCLYMGYDTGSGARDIYYSTAAAPPPANSLIYPVVYMANGATGGFVPRVDVRGLTFRSGSQ